MTWQLQLPQALLPSLLLLILLLSSTEIKLQSKMSESKKWIYHWLLSNDLTWQNTEYQWRKNRGKKERQLTTRKKNKIRDEERRHHRARWEQSSKRYNQRMNCLTIRQNAQTIFILKFPLYMTHQTILILIMSKSANKCWI